MISGGESKYSIVSDEYDNLTDTFESVIAAEMLIQLYYDKYGIPKETIQRIKKQKALLLLEYKAVVKNDGVAKLRLAQKLKEKEQTNTVKKDWLLIQTIRLEKHFHKDIDIYKTPVIKFMAYIDEYNSYINAVKEQQRTKKRA